MAYRGRAHSYRAGDANLEEHLREEIAKEKRKAAQLQEQLKTKQEEKQRMLDSDKQREIDYLKQKLVGQATSKDANIEEKQHRENELHDERMRHLKSELAEDKRRLEQSMQLGADPHKIPIETICKATAMSLSLMLLKRGVKCRVNSSSWRECLCFAPWQNSTLTFRPGSTMDQGKLYVTVGNTLDSFCKGIGLNCFRCPTTKVLELDKLISVRFGPSTKGKRSIDKVLARGRVDLVFNDTPTVVSLQFEGDWSSSGTNELPADTIW